MSPDHATDTRMILAVICIFLLGAGASKEANDRPTSAVASKEASHTSARLTDNCHEYVWLGGPSSPNWSMFGYMKKQAGRSSYKQMFGGHILKFKGDGWVVTVSDTVDDILAYTEGSEACVYEVTSPWFYLDHGEWQTDPGLHARVSPEEQCAQDAMCAGCDVQVNWEGHDWCCANDCHYGWMDLPNGGCVCGH